MRQLSITLIMICAVMCAQALSSTAKAQTVTDAEVKEAIKILKERLYQHQEADGLWVDGWPESDDNFHDVQWGGTTALATYALLQAGESFQHPALQKPLEFLTTANIRGTYAVALRAQLWGILPSAYDQYMARDVKWLIDAKMPGPNGGYIYSYAMPDKSKKGKNRGYSNSRVKFGLLGLWEGAKRGHKVPDDIWKGVAEHYIKTQNKDGGWQYNLKGMSHSRGSMTAAGLIALHAIEDYYHRKDFKNPGVKLPIQKSIEQGLAWFDKNFVADSVPEVGGKKGGYSNLFYYLYAMERVGLASGVKYFNGKPWFESGARVIVDQVKQLNELDPGRKMNSSYKTRDKANQSISLAFALIFLARGSSPVLVNKLELPNVAWNNRPSDMTQLTKWMSDNMETPVIWQRIPISTNPDTWQDAPILYLASHQPISLSDAEKNKIKKYIDAGGVLITSSDNRSASFSNSIKELMADIYPSYEYQPMTVDDPVFSAIHQFEKLPTKIEVLNNGVRHLAMHFPDDLSWTFHSENRTNLDTWKMFVNVVYYATGGWPRSRRSARNEKVQLTGPSIGVGRMKYDGNYDPEPGAWKKLNRLMGNRVQAKLRYLDFNELDSATEKFIHMVGTDDYKITEAQLKQIYKYAERGGTFLIENASGDAQFTDSIMEAMRNFDNQSGLFPIDTMSSTVTGEGLNGYDLSIARYRKFSIVLLGRTSKRVRLQEMLFENGGRILISPEDMTSGMLGAPAWGINGYSPDTSRKLMVNLMLSSTGEKAAAERKAKAQAQRPQASAPEKKEATESKKKKNAGKNKKNAGDKKKKNKKKK